MISGFILVDKPSGWTSHDVVGKVRSLVSQKKVGHAGTLDPAATGLVILGLGKATRLLRLLQEFEKEYVARVVFGVATDTLDADGAVLAREPMDFGENQLRAILPRFTGTIMQIPPMVSAVQVGGRRLYELARKGVIVEREARQVQVHSIDLVEFSPGRYPEATLRIVCGKGTYVRSIADDLGRALGGYAHIGSLRRTRNGSFHVDVDGRPLDELIELGPDRLAETVLSMAEGLRDLPGAAVDEETARAVSHGVPFSFRSFDAGDAPDGGVFRVLGPDGRLLAIYRRVGGIGKPEVVVA